MRNILVTMMYDGSHFHGWQIQDNALTVQEVFQNALFKVIGEKTDIKGCSRTDSGVHANMYCVSFHTQHTIPCKRLVAALNRYLPMSVAVTDAQEVDDDFHARYNCKGKEYIYKIWNSEIRNPFLDGYALHYWYKLDVDLLNEAARHFLGSHDFTSFCTLDNREKGDFTRTVSNISLKRDGDMVIFTIEADGFLYNMVRIIVGTLLRVAQGKIKPGQIPSIINALDRSKAGPTAPPQGLYLNKVRY
ncbi:MAG: tRNA pseudouridine(38-40) synthase TruA [Acutalibacteraceae bacterium]